MRRARQWLRPTVRLRLAVSYGALFLFAGALLIGFTDALVAKNLPSAPSAPSASALRALAKECNQLPGKEQNSNLATKCKAAFSAGVGVGAKDLRGQALTVLTEYSLIGLAVMTLLSGGIGWFIAGRVLRPVRAVTEAARRASEQHLGERIALKGPPDELKEMADTFDSMLDRLDRALSSQRHFVANASHELRTPLTVMRTAVDVTLAKPHRTEEQLEGMALEVRAAVVHAEALVESLLTLARSNGDLRRDDAVDLAAAASAAVRSAELEAERKLVKLESELQPAATRGDGVLLRRLLANLVDNAVRYNQPGGWVRVATSSSPEGSVVRVINSGPVIDAEIVPALFEPFRRLEERVDGQGIGMGLAIVDAIARAHQGTISAQPGSEGGLDVRVVLPVKPPARPAM